VITDDQLPNIKQAIKAACLKGSENDGLLTITLIKDKLLIKDL